MEKCFCYDINIVWFDHARACNETEVVNCGYPAYLSFYESFQDDCLQFCPEECNSIRFIADTSLAQFPTPLYFDLLRRHDTFFPNIKYPRNLNNLEDSKSKLVSLNIYFDDISYISIEEKPTKSSEQFVADLGGFMGE